MSSSTIEDLLPSLNLRSPSTELELPACPIVDLPLKLLEPIVSHLDCEDLYSLASTSKLFHATYRLRAILMKLRPYSSCGGTNCQWNGELFCLSNAEPGEVGWTPFFMMNTVSESFIGEMEPHLTVEVVSLDFERFDPDEPTEEYLFIQHTDSLVSIREEYWNEPQFFEDANHSRLLTWDNDLAGRLVRATPEMLEKRFMCPECNGSGEMMVGTIGVEKRWPLLSTRYARPLPCPRCRIPHRTVAAILFYGDENIEAETVEEEETRGLYSLHYYDSDGYEELLAVEGLGTP